MDITIHEIISDLKSGVDLESSRMAHAKAVECIYHSDVYLASSLISMYGKCGSMFDAHCVFENVMNPDVVSWTALLSGYADNGQGHATLHLYSCMKNCRCIPNSFTYIAALKAVTSLAGNANEEQRRNYLEQGRVIHLEVGTHLNRYVQSTLITMYAKLGSMIDAHDVFKSIRKPDVVCWTTLMLGSAENGDGRVTLALFSKMKAEGVCIPNSVTFVALVKACTSLALKNGRNCLKLGKAIHLEISSHLNHYLQNTLIDMYSKCESMVDAHGVFRNMSKPDLVSWNALLLGYVENGQGDVALDLFYKMKEHGCTYNYVTFIAALKACTSLYVNGVCRGLELGRRIHSQIGSHMTSHVQSTLIDMYAKCGSMLEARRVFDTMQKHDVVSWTSLLLGYAENGGEYITLDLFSRMKASGCLPNAFSYVSVLKACTSLAANDHSEDYLQHGREIHSEIAHISDYHVQSSLIDMYSKFGRMPEAHCAFDRIQKANVICWNALMLGYAENGEGHSALRLFSKMKTSECKPDSVTYLAAIKSCGLVGALTLGRKFHLELNELNTQLITCLVDFYAKCGSLDEAQRVLDQHPSDVTTWTALLAGYARFGDAGTVFELFEAMEDGGIQPNGVTFLCLLLCCSHSGLVEKAKGYLETMYTKFNITPSIMHYNCLVDGYGRANQLSRALGVIQRMPCNSNTVTWMTLLGACRNWKNLEIGRGAFQELANMQRKTTSSYILMAHIYGRMGMWEEQEVVIRAGQELC